MKKLWLIFIAIFRIFVCDIRLGRHGDFRQAPPIPREVVTTDGQSSDWPRKKSPMGKMSGRQWAEWRAARFGGMALTSRPTGRRIICIAKHSSS